MINRLNPIKSPIHGFCDQLESKSVNGYLRRIHSKFMRVGEGGSGEKPIFSDFCLG